ncbi:hypothetical protein HanIR_Chr16g0812881 [Helianthus annuus]|nr:hypothetical protein HanIR_Chr16g0812881 [Helianthus annuus]
MFFSAKIWCYLQNFDCRGLVHLFWFRCLQMWSADCRHFTSEKTNSTLISYEKKRKEKCMI